MSRHARVPIGDSGAADERERFPSSNGARETYRLAGGHRDEIYGPPKRTNDVAKHRRGTSTSDVPLKRLREGQRWESQSRDEFIPELVLGAPLEDMQEVERRTLQTQWTDALKKVQSLRHGGAGTQSERWSGVAADIYRPKSLTEQNSMQPSGARTSRAMAALDHWNYYPGPSVSRDTPALQQDVTVPVNKKVGTDQWTSSVLGGDLVRGRGARSVITLAKTDPSVSGDDMMTTQQERDGAANLRAANWNSGSPLDQFDELPLSKRLPGADSRVQRTQSQRYGRRWGQKPEANHVRGTSGSNPDAALPGPVLKKAISMREGGAHADAVTEMARAYTGTMCGVPKTLECASCGRSLGIIVQGNPGVDIAFCQACRPSPLQWRKSVSEDASGYKKKKNGIVRFCRKILRLDRKSS